ncbi:tRNA (5-methylaminomethyl-2-thiouridylate)-methyltransferase [Pseudoxanthobacter soli DSM 19599]|uniref:tRNA-specific 2-thiouridylase MnmA n=1 Tax=Pseudoxanthobacter soli DSM 19599 TaxID=1123029 RepID=A0A1M7Z518_9HYPH|nr:tRNA 2-thiouridine(34) synthase MnmA [Pseudoxanthobacter soli]SHO59912.1 tRNA (5-methylaminomethyl-2-thiouridylate)-methyltransferase [Pseudoxanthobacter soli DSM 19599]
MSENAMRIDLDLPGRPQDHRVVVAMSGGVDSSLVAALVKQAGYDVVGVTLQLYDHGEASHRPGACCAGRDIRDARRVAETLGIPHYVLDMEERFRDAVIEGFADSYLAGETPVPCVACNQTVKFSDLLETARDLGATALATGHYVSTRGTPSGRGLFRPADAERDQSYFLFATTRAQLDFVRFPLGEIPKSETRRLARDLGLVVADKPDSQDICFVPTGRYAEMIERLRPGAAEPGEIVHTDGRVLGRHRGIIHFTIGQRRGLGLSIGEPLYVVSLDPESRRVVVGPREALVTRRVPLRDVNWIGDGTLEEAAAAGLEIHARVRSTRDPAPALLHIEDGAVFVDLVGGESGVAPGQACVLYEGPEPRARVLGGGFIARGPHTMNASPEAARSPVPPQDQAAPGSPTLQTSGLHGLRLAG